MTSRSCILFALILSLSGCNLEPGTDNNSSNIAINSPNIPQLDANKIIFSTKNNQTICHLKDCIQKPFTEELYQKLFSGNSNEPAGITMGSYYLIDNAYKLKIYAAAYTEEGEVDFDYIIVNNGVNTDYIELPIDSSYSINNNLEIDGYSNKSPTFKYKILSTGSISKIN